MDYLINRGLYRSHNAAKSYHYKQKDLVDFLKIEKRKFNKVLDYGCGKLRYFHNLRTISNQLFLLDSDQQLFREQILYDKKTTIIKFASKYKNVNILTIKTIKNYYSSFDFILLSNVLSCIPIKKERENILKNIEFLLSKNGKALIVTQFENPEFKKYENKPGCIKLNNGYLFPSNNQQFYYAIIKLSELENIIKKTKLIIVETREIRGRLFCWVKKS